MFEQTLVLIKPDGVMMGKKVVQAIKERYVSAGLQIVEEYERRLEQSEAQEFYREHQDRHYFPGLVLAMSSDRSIGLVVTGRNAIKVVRETNGDPDLQYALPGTIRCDFRSAGGPFNTVHGSDSPEAFEREYAIFFQKPSKDLRSK